MIIIFSVPENVISFRDGPACKVDIVALVTKDDAWWIAKKKYRKVNDELLPNSDLVERKYPNFVTVTV